MTPADITTLMASTGDPVQAHRHVLCGICRASGVDITYSAIVLLLMKHVVTQLRPQHSSPWLVGVQARTGARSLDGQTAAQRPLCHGPELVRPCLAAY